MSEQLNQQEPTRETTLRDGIVMWLGAVAKSGWKENIKLEHTLKGYSVNVTPRPILQDVKTGYTHMRYWDGREVNVSEIPVEEHLFDTHGPRSYSEEHPFTNGKSIKVKRLSENDPNDLAIVVSTPEVEAGTPLRGMSVPKVRDELIVHISHLSLLEFEVIKDTPVFMEESRDRRIG